MASLLVAGSKQAPTSQLRLSFRRRGELHRPEPRAEEAETNKHVVELLLWTEIGKNEQIVKTESFP